MSLGKCELRTWVIVRTLRLHRMAAPAPVALGDTLGAPPADGVTALRFSPESDLLVCSSWDRRAPRGFIEHASPVLDVCVQDDSVGFSGCLDGQVKRLSFQGLTSSTLAFHQAAVRCIEYLPSRGLLLTGSWDSTVRAWDPRAPPPQACVQVISLPGKVYSMSCSRDSLVVGTSERNVLVFDLRKYQTRSIACYIDGRGYALGSVEGRVAMEYFEQTPEAQANKYAFKCHRRQENGKELAFPVHSIVFHPGYGTFATGGGDGVINLWDGENKKRLFQISRYPSSVAALAFSRDGTMLAVASSYTFEQGEQNEPSPDEIYVRKMQDAEVRPKQRK